MYDDFRGVVFLRVKEEMCKYGFEAWSLFKQRDGKCIGEELRYKYVE